MPIRISCFLLTITLALSSRVVWAQPSVQSSDLAYPKMQDQGVFTSDGDWVYFPYALGSGYVIETPGTLPLTRIQRVKAPEAASLFASVRNGFLWGIGRKKLEPGSAKGWVSSLYRFDYVAKEAQWEILGEIDVSHGFPLLLVPLDRTDWFLGVNNTFGFTLENRGSFVALFHRQGERISFEELVDMPFRDKSTIVETIALPVPNLATTPKNEGEKKSSPSLCVARPARLSPNLWLPAMLPDALVLASSRAGVLWIFSLENGACKRVVDLGNIPDADMDKLDHLGDHLLSLQPTWDHHLVALTREPETLKFAAALYTSSEMPKEVRREQAKRFQEIMEGFTRLRWWSIDPVRGTVEPIEDREHYAEHPVPFLKQASIRFLMGTDERAHVNFNGTWDDVLRQTGLKALTDPQAVPVVERGATEMPPQSGVEGKKEKRVEKSDPTVKKALPSQPSQPAKSAPIQVPEKSPKAD